MPVPLQFAPLHPIKTEPLAGVAVSVTVVPTEGNRDEHAAPPVDVHALMPAGALVTEPPPDTVTVKVGGSFQANGGV